MKNKIDIFYDYFLLICRKKKAKKLLYLVSFLESIIFPLPTDPFLIPFIIAEKKFFYLAGIVTFFSVLGGVFAYVIGSFAWFKIQPFVEVHYSDINLLISEFENSYNELGIFMILMGGFSPFPYKITCLASGILGINILLFILLSILSRGLRFLIVSFLIFKYGEFSLKIIKKNILQLSCILLVLLVIFYFIL